MLIFDIQAVAAREVANAKLAGEASADDRVRRAMRGNPEADIERAVNEARKQWDR